MQVCLSTVDWAACDASGVAQFPGVAQSSSHELAEYVRLDGMGLEGQGHPARPLSGRDGCCVPSARLLAFDIAALPGGRVQGGNREYAAHLPSPAVVQLLRCDPSGRARRQRADASRRLGAKLGDDVIPGENTKLCYRYVLERHALLRRAKLQSVHRSTGTKTR